MIDALKDDPRLVGLEYERQLFILNKERNELSDRLLVEREKIKSNERIG